MHGTALNTMQNECGELPLQLRRRMMQLKYAAKIKAQDNHPAKQVILDHRYNYSGRYKKGQECFATKVLPIFKEQNG